MNKTKIKFIKILTLFVIVLIIIWISNIFYYKKLQNMSNENKVIEYELDSNGYEKIDEFEN